MTTRAYSWSYNAPGYSFLSEDNVCQAFKESQVVRITHVGEYGVKHTHTFLSPGAPGESVDEAIDKLDFDKPFTRVALDLTREMGSTEAPLRSVLLRRIVCIESLLPRIPFPNDASFESGFNREAKARILSETNKLSMLARRKRVVVLQKYGRDEYRWIWGFGDCEYMAGSANELCRVRKYDTGEERVFKLDRAIFVVGYKMLPEATYSSLTKLDGLDFSPLKAALNLIRDRVPPNEPTLPAGPYVSTGPVVMSWPQAVTLSLSNGLVIELPANTTLTVTPKGN